MAALQPVANFPLLFHFNPFCLCTSKRQPLSAQSTSRGDPNGMVYVQLNSQPIMKALNELTNAQLEQLKIRYSAAELRFAADKASRQTRLDNRLERQAADTTLRNTLESNLATAITLRDMAIANGADAATVAGAEELVSNSQSAVDGITSSANWVSDVDAHVLQAEIDELEQARANRAALVVTIDGLLGT